MASLWQQLEQLFEEEIRSADFAQSDLEKILEARISRSEGESGLDGSIISMAERGVLQWQAETHQRLGRAIHGFLRDARIRSAKVDQP